MDSERYGSLESRQSRPSLTLPLSLSLWVDATAENVQLKQDTMLQLDLDDCNSSTEDTPPTMIIVETCISTKEPATTRQSALKQYQQLLQVEPMETTASAASPAAAAAVEAADQAGCSLTLGLKPSVQYKNIMPHGANCEELLSCTEAALAAANISCATDAFASSNELGVSKLRRCVDGATQCNNLNLDYDQSNSSDSMPSMDSLVCRICHNADNPEQ